MKINNMTILGIFSSVLLLVIVITASFAYFGSFNVNLNNNVAVNVNAYSPGDAVFTSNATQLNLQVPAANMSQLLNGTLAAENTATLSINLTGAADLLTTCTYDIVYEYDDGSYIYGGTGTNHVSKNGDKEITLQVTNVNGTNSFASEKNFDYDSDWSNNKRTLVSGATISSTGSLTTQNINITGKFYNLNVSQESIGGKAFTGKIYVTNHSCKTSDGMPITTLMSTSTPDVYDENGLRYEGADPNNYICLDNKTSGACSNTSLLFRIIGLFDEEYSTDGTTSAGTKKLLKILDTNNYGGTSGKEWDDETATTSSVSNNSNNNINIKVNLLKTKYKIKMLAEPTTCFNCSNNWSSSSLKKELNESYLTTLLEISGVNSKLENAIVSSKWHLGGANGTSSSNYYSPTITTENWYKAERSPYATSGTLQNLRSGNPEYVYAKVGLMYPSDYGYATIGGSTTNKAGCRARALNDWSSSSYSDCKNNDWIYKSQSISWGSNKTEWLISPYVPYSRFAANLNSTGYADASESVTYQFAVRPTFYLDSSILKIVGGSGTKDNAYRIG